MGAARVEAAGSRWAQRGHRQFCPSLRQALQMVYHFEKIQKIRVRVFDADEHSQHDFAGETVNLTLADVMAGRNSQKTVNLSGSTKNGRATGTCTLRGEEMKNQTGTVRMQCRGVKLANKDGLFGKSDPFIRISRVPLGSRTQAAHLHANQSKNLPIFKTEVIMNDLNPT